MFSSEGIPVTPSDWERAFGGIWSARSRLGCSLLDTPREILATQLWPLDEQDERRSRSMRLRRAIDNAGANSLLVIRKKMEKSQLLVGLGRGVIRGLIRKQMDRIPIITEAIVTRFHPLVLHCSEEDGDIPTPNFLIDDMKGELEDLNGHRSKISKGRLLLNAGVVSTEVYSNRGHSDV